MIRDDQDFFERLKKQANLGLNGDQESPRPTLVRKPTVATIPMRMHFRSKKDQTP